MPKRAAPGILLILTLLLINILALTFNIQPVRASGTIYIRADGNIDPSDAPIMRSGDLYTLTGNITSDVDGIVVERDNIILDGASCTVQCTSSGTGIDLSERSNITIKNINVEAFYGGIMLAASSNNSISGSNITNNRYGIELYYSSSNNVSGNNITANSECGIYVSFTSDNGVYHNNFVNNTRQVRGLNSINVWDDGYPSGGNYWSDYSGVDERSGSNQDQPGSDDIGDTPYIIDADNKDRYPLPLHGAFPVYNRNTGFHYATIQGAIDSNETSDRHTIFVGEGTYFEHVVINKSVALIGENRNRTIVDGSSIGTVMNITASHVDVTGLTIQRSGSHPNCGLYISSNFNNVSCNIVRNCPGTYYSWGYAMELQTSSNNIISGNIITSNPMAALVLYNSSNNVVSENKITDNEIGIGLSGEGLEFPEIPLSPSLNNTIFGNNITNNKEAGVSLYRSPNNTIYQNNVSNNTIGISISDYISSNNAIYENNVTDNVEGISFITSGNRVYHNNFMNNTQQASIATSGNVWDDGYPSGGNYWSDYNGTDQKKGLAQDQPGTDGIGDTPYNIYTSIIQDRYPLMKPWLVVTIAGDINLDGAVDIYDAILLANTFNSRLGDSSWNANVDLNGDGLIDIFDAIILANNFGKTGWEK